MKWTRRTLLSAAAGLVLAACQQRPHLASVPDAATVALLHLAPVAGEIEANRAALIQGLRVAAEAGADLVVTPELCVSGYSFADLIGTDWIEPQPDGWLTELQAVARELEVTVIVGMPERDPDSDLLHNAMMAIGPDGSLHGRHRKIRTLKVGSEAWSSPGSDVAPVPTPLGPLGMFICADAVDPEIATSLRDQGATLLVSSANWAPGLYGPDGEWERCSDVTSLPLIVCNRTGVGRTLDFSAAESVVVCKGERRLSLSSVEPALFLIHWDLERGEPVSHRKVAL